MGGHARSEYLVQRGDGFVLFERGKAPQPLLDPVAFQRDARTHGYKHIFGEEEPERLPRPGALEALGAAIAAKPYNPPGDSDIPAGYTYLGQFIFHDISFMGPGRCPESERTAALDLD